MRKITLTDRIVLALLVLIASYQIVSGLNRFSGITVFYFTVAFGVLIIAGLLLILFGYEILKNQFVIVIATLIPLSLSLGLISNNYRDFHLPYLIFAFVGLILIAITRLSPSKTLATVSIVLVHGISGITIFLLPILLYIKKSTPFEILFISLGATLIGIGGILLAFLQTGRSIISGKFIFALLPWILFLTTLAFYAGLGGL